MKNLETVGTKQSNMRSQIISTLTSLTASANLKFSGNSSSKFVHVANMDKVDKHNSAGRPSGYTNNSKSTGLVTFDTDFSKLTVTVLKEVLKINGISSTGNKYDLLQKLKTISKETLKTHNCSPDSTSSNSISNNVASNCGSNSGNNSKKSNSLLYPVMVSHSLLYPVLVKLSKS